MKNVSKLIAILFIGAVTFSCGTKNKEGEDTNKVAEEANEDKFKTNESENDAKFVAEAVAGNYAEIQLSQLAQQKSNNSLVKEVAKSLETEHSKLLKGLQALADKKAISTPAEPEQSAKKKIEDLNNEGNLKDFNKEWCKTMVDKHEKAIKEFETRWEKTQDEDLKNWISETLPHLRTHLDKVKACDENINQTK